MLEGLSSDILERPASLTADDTDGDVLAHFGIKGQKWGVRRYQNSDGSLTEEGKLRYRDSRQSSTNANLTKGQARFIKDAKASLRKTPPDKDVDAYNQTLKDLGKAAEESGVMDPSDVLSPYHLSSSPDQSSMLSAIHDNMPTVKENNERYYKSEADKYKENADGFRKEKIDKLDETINEFYPDLHKELGTKPGKETRNYLIDAVKGFNEGDPDMVTYQHMNGADGLLYDGYLDEKTFNKLYDGQAAEDAVDNLHYGWNSDDIKQYNGWYKELHQSDDTSDFLAHHGIKGQKWGNRRYQNSDGSLTALGRVRYGVGAARRAAGKAAIAGGKAAGKALRKATGMQTDAELDEELAKAQKKYDRAAKKRAIAELSGKRTPLSKMTDAEIDQYLNRLNKTKQINALEKDIKDQGRGFVSKFAHNAMNNAANSLATGIGEGIKRGISQKISDSLSEDKNKKAADDARNKKNSYQDKLELRALKGDKDAAKQLRKVANAKKGKKNGDGQGGSDKPDDSGDTKKKSERDKTREAWGKTNPMSALRDFDNDPEAFVNGRKSNKKEKNKKDKKNEKSSNGTHSQDEYYAARQKAKENLKQQASTPVSEVKSHSADNYTKNWIMDESSKKTPPIGKNY